jgi:hypothetical protein
MCLPVESRLGRVTSRAHVWSRTAGLGGGSEAANVTFAAAVTTSEDRQSCSGWSRSRGSGTVAAVNLVASTGTREARRVAA